MRELARARIGETFNFYRDGSGAKLRRERLCAYLESRRDAPFVLVGEAAGYRGARVSGIAFTSERQLTGVGVAEATATIVHRVLRELAADDAFLLWNVVPTHPHRPHEPGTNRRPAASEIAGGMPFLGELVRGRTAIAVGRVAHSVLGGRYVRHPSHGGSGAFREGLLLSIGRCGTS